ncbi:FAD-binding oxidoreductase [Streptomonospora sp. S1-112]|uniref:FAD-binding oxidoreductase n=1 Tax=Streptomonospora mangrovi TaxID=2883123 RepID=A0A9X3NPA4_9ACTN|nr:FAD-binding oxidoreductase [Streptomonospora mangrovi]MDA0564170.1 FAD-binding oxidoreductase [Streptomonospora mangrovi]
MNVIGAVSRPPDSAAWDELRASVAGRVLVPGDPDYDDARSLADPRFRLVRPSAVVRCAGTDDVRAALAFARRHRLTPRPRSGGHSYAGYSTGPGLVVDVSLMDAVEVEGETARVAAGARSGAVARVLQDHGRLLPLGTCPGVGIAGLALGGGMGTVGRRYGLTLDHVRAARIVLADGRVLDCTPDSHADLLWALRGAGAGNFGVVTRFTFRTRTAPTVHSFLLEWPWRHAAAVLEAWQGWAPDLPDCMSTQAALRVAQARVTVTGAWLGGADGSAAYLDQFVGAVGHEPHRTARGSSTYPESIDFLWEGLAVGSSGPPPRAFHRDDLLTRPLPSRAVADLLGRLGADRPAGQERYCVLDLMGGAYGHDPDTAWSHRSCLFDVRYRAAVPAGADLADALAARAWADSFARALAPWACGQSYQNHISAARPDWARAYYGDHLDRLRHVKAAYDPDRLFRYPQGI